ncbi:cilia- and flagella-associated protein 97 isoform X1 [Lates calcarifer]|uniref:Cilia- and flagella-associated protein 97 n=1 Tax=Lates calcarifer TaxID=8187 RepID=A0AAJ8B550_LATCA|nr:cilia- and flagella-associated protein 97 isoform X1 [Lates calcarifer]
MFNPSELEGEVDHSFFDSDCGDGSFSRDRWKKMESSPVHERLGAKQTAKQKDGLSPRTDGIKKDQVNKNRSTEERKENSYQSKVEEKSRASNASSIASRLDEVINNSSDSEENNTLHFKRPDGTFMALLAEGREVHDKDVYNQSPNETEEEALPSSAKHLGSKRRNKQSPKKLIRNRRTRSPSPSSTEASIDADSESSSRSSNGRSSLGSPTLPKPKKSSLCPGERRARVGSAGSRDLPASHTEESDDTVTDVSPLSSPDISPLQSLDLNHTEAEQGGLTEQQQQHQQQQQESVPSSGLSSIHQDEDSDQDVDEYSLSSESQLEDKLVFRCPGGRNRKNYSFTNDEVRRIDRENQRLLRELLRLSPSPRPGSVVRKKTSMAGNSPLVRLSHSALNRQREQQRIERENLAFLKRLESVKPTPGLMRSEQLADYQRQVGYLGAPSYPISGSTSKKTRSASRSSSDGCRGLINRRRRLAGSVKQLWMTDTGKKHPLIHRSVRLPHSH